MGQMIQRSNANSRSIVSSPLVLAMQFALMYSSVSDHQSQNMLKQHDYDYENFIIHNAICIRLYLHQMQERGTGEACLGHQMCKVQPYCSFKNHSMV